MEIQKIQILIYNLKVNGIIEKSYEPIKNALSKIKGKWTINLPAILFADRIITNAFTSYMPFYLIYGKELIFLVKTYYFTWKSLFIKEIENCSKLIQFQATQFQLKQNYLNEVYLRKTRWK